MTNVPSPTFGPTGFIVPSDAAILQGVQEDINAAFGGGLNPGLTTPQGQLATSEAAVVANADATFLFYTQQVDPAYSSGRMQDAIARIYFLTRKGAQPTVVQGICTGLAGVAILTGSLVQDTSGNLYTCTAGGVIGSGGTVTLPFANNAVGPIPCLEGTLTTIYQAVPGWDSITNPDDGVLGNDTESRQAFEARRAASVAINSNGALGSILGAVLAVSDVLDAYVTENDTASPVTVGGFTLAPNSVYVCVAGGGQADVAQAIWSRKAPGCAYNGNTTVVVTDNNPGYAPPYPTYSVKYETPDALAVLFSIVIVNSSQVPSNAAALIQAAIVDAFAGADGGPRARIGSLILASRYYSTVAALGPWAQIQDIQVGSDNTPSAVFNASVAAANMTVVSVASGTIAVGQTVSDITGMLIEGTTILSQTSGSPGGTGVYVLSQTQPAIGASFTGTGAGTSLTTTAVTGVINVGDLIAGTGVPSDTTILDQVSGSPGGAGVYTTSNATTSSSDSLTTTETVTSAVADSNSVQVQIDQVPTVAVPNIVVTLS